MKVAASRSHLNYVDGLRAIAALSVVLHHTWIESRLPVYQFGHDAVGLFIVISGFCLMLPVIKANGILTNGAINFFKRRAWRILPTYFAAMAFSLVLIWLFLSKQIQGYYDESYDVNVKGLVAHILLMQDIFTSTSTQINGPFWSIAVEWRIYFLFPVFVAMTARWGAVRTAGIAIFASLILSLILLQTPLNMGNHGISPQYLALFVFGMLSAQIVFSEQPFFSSLKTRIPWALIMGILTIALIILNFAKPWSGNIVPSYLSDYVVGLWSIALIVAISRPNTMLYRIVSWRPLVQIGTFAYSIYLIHAPLVHLLWQDVMYPLHLPPLAMFALMTILGIPIIIGICYLFYLVAERPFITRRPTANVLVAHSVTMP